MHCVSSKVFGAALLAVFLNLITTEVLAGNITGEIKFVDDPPKPPIIRVSKDQDYCGETLPDETYPYFHNKKVEISEFQLVSSSGRHYIWGSCRWTESLGESQSEAL